MTGHLQIELGVLLLPYMESSNIPASQAPTFNGLGIAPGILEVLALRGLVSPTPIQNKAIPMGIAGQDVIGVAQTGTGKTLAFGIPLIQRLAVSKGRALILLPTRELALQVDESLGQFGARFGLRGVVLIGGASMGKQVMDMRRDPNVLIATPGRLLDHMQGGTVSLHDISILVLDEADRMLDMGFWPQIREIMSAVPKDRQTMLFSATLSREITDLATKHMKTPTSIEVAPPGTTADKISQEFYIVRKDQKLQLLETVLSKYNGSTIVFSRTKHGAKRIARAVRDMGHTSAEIHANRSLAQRREALEGFKRGKYRVLVATDIAARGIDVQDVELVVNYDVPSKTEDYVHRIGRTARAGKNGHAISFAMPDEKRTIRDIERLIRKPLAISMTPTLPPARVMPYIEDDEPRGFGNRSGGGRPRSSSRPSFGGARPSSSGRPFRPHFSRR